jgi:hypothetical protein
MENHGGLAHEDVENMMVEVVRIEAEIFQIFTIRNVSSTSFHQQNMG